MDERIIEKVREHEILYNNTLPSYRDQTIRQDSWQKIGWELGMTAEAVKITWDKLRRAYLSALSRRQPKKGDYLIKSLPPWKFESQMSFLVPFVTKRKTRNSIVDTSVYDSDVLNDLDNSKPGTADLLFICSDNDEDLHPTTCENDDNSLHVQGLNDTVREIVNILKEDTILRKRKYDEKCTNTFPLLDETDMFFMSMSKMAKKLPLVEQLKIKKKLSNAVLDTRIKMFEEQLNMK